jgi:maltose alpha-D-glucosyltransferase/alpha-amylase
MRKRIDKHPSDEDGPLWYKDAIVYELHVRAFSDSDVDGVGDIRGLIDKLDYLHDLGVTAIWLLPFFPSPLKDDGYDVSDYVDIQPVFGNMSDFRTLVEEAHQRGLRIIIELVLNHTSDQHPWFQRARRAPPGSRWRDFYIWSDTTNRYREARIIFKDSEQSNWSWDSVAKAYYWHRFYSHQPDLNYDNPAVHRAIINVVNFWLRLGVDGFRVDAVPYLYKREGTTCENLPETHVYLKGLRKHIDAKFKDRMLLAEANQWPEDAVAYFGDGDEFHMAFHFPLMPRMFMAIRMEDRFPILDILEQTPRVPDNCQWALFLRNHDELTLEMVADEERDYMYRVYAHDPVARLNLGIRRRLAPLLNNNRRKIELMNILLFSLPGTPVIYYGDEIGMGDNVYLGDRNGVRTPMQWSPDRNAGFSRTNPQKLYLPPIIDPEYHYESVNVENQQGNPDSLLWWMKRLIALRKRYKSLGRGSISFLQPENRKILAFIRQYQGEAILVVANLSHSAQQGRLDLAAFKGASPVELFGRSDFAPVGDGEYDLTLGPYGFYWFSLETQSMEAPRQHLLPTETEETPAAIPAIALDETELMEQENWPVLEELLLNYLPGRRWFRGKARRIQSCQIEDVVPFDFPDTAAHLFLARVDYCEGEPETYAVPLSAARKEEAQRILTAHRRAVIAHLKPRGEAGDSPCVLYDAMVDRAFCGDLLNAIGKRRRFKGEAGTVAAVPGRVFETLGEMSGTKLGLDNAPIKAERSNTSVTYGDRLILKLFRHLEEGPNPDLEVGRFLTEEAHFPHAPPLAGSLEYHRKNRRTSTLAVLHGLVPNAVDAWRYTLDTLDPYFQRALAHPTVQVPPIPLTRPLFLNEPVPALVQETVGPYLSSAHLLGERTAQLHLALASDQNDPEFRPEPFSLMYQTSVYHAMRSSTAQTMDALRARLDILPESVRREAEAVLASEDNIIARFQPLRSIKFSGWRIRCHGDYHLGQVLYTGRDFVIIDFEGETRRPLSERRLKRSPLRDVAGMVRSFDYAANFSVVRQASTAVDPGQVPLLERWAKFWSVWVTAVFVTSYLNTAKQASLLPDSQRELAILLNAYLLDRAVSEIGYELDNRPDWVRVPIRGILHLTEG